jgi:YD repeat-containing protein
VIRRIAALLFVLSLAAPALFAEQDRTQLKGFTPEGVFQFLGLDNVNIFSGNLVLTVPLGQEYAVGGGLTYRFQFVCNGNLWDSEVTDDPECHHAVPGYRDGCIPVDALADRRANAGLGCIVTLGRLFPPQHVTTSEASAKWTYEAPDGSDHHFEATLYADSTTADDGVDVEYTRDGTYLRMRRISDTERVIEFPDGTVHRFEPSGTGQNDHWRLVEITNQFPDNFVKVAYCDETIVDDTPQLQCPAQEPTQWHVTDSHGRKHVLRFSKKAYDGTPEVAMIDSIELEAASTEGAVASQISAEDERAVYSFTYYPDDHKVAVPYWDTEPNSPILSNDETHVPLVRRLTRPDGTFYELDHMSNATYGTSGLPYRMRLPTRGCIAWEWGWYSKPNPSADGTPHLRGSHGIVRRILSDNTCPSPFSVLDLGMAEWNYQPMLKPEGHPLCGDGYASWGNGIPPACDHAREMSNRVIDPLGHSTIHYFSVSPFDNTGGWRESEWGAPFTHHRPGTGGLLLSQEAFDCRRGTDGKCLPILRDAQDPHRVSRCEIDADEHCRPNSGNNGALLRREYLKYESDLEPGLPYFFGDDGNMHNTRVVSSSTVFSDDGDRSVLTQHSDHDGYGHYRTTVQSGFPSLSRTSNTAYAPQVTAGKWLLNLFTAKSVEENGVARKSVFDFETANGALKATRVLSGNCPAPEAGRCENDVLTLFNYDTSGNVVLQRTYGGDGSGLDKTACCTPNIRPTYRVSNSYAYGSLSETHHHDPSTCTDATQSSCPSVLRGAKYTIDPDTGLVTESYDAAGVKTVFDYDAFGRILRQKPDGRAWTVYDYIPASATRSAEVTVSRYANGTTSGLPLTKTRHQFDDLGRPIREYVLMADGTESRREVVLNGLGWKTAVTELGASSTLPKTETRYDAFGRPVEVKAPDGSITKLAYSGVRETTRTSTVATPLGDKEATVTERYDAFGRLREVVEQSGDTSASKPTGTATTTSYSYDPQDRLTAVTTGVQSRTFTYDGRGFLTKETHPESNETSYTYDAGGHALAKDAAGAEFDLTFTYDRAERLTEVSTAEGALLKKFEFGSAGTLAGRLWKATRWNHPRKEREESVVRVTEEYGYDAAGRPNQRTTSMVSVEADDLEGTGDFVVEPIVQSAAYTDLDQEEKVVYPACAGCGEKPRTIRPTYKHGRVDTVPGFVLSTTYSDNGMWFERQHANGVLERQLQDPNKMQRPLEIAAYNVVSCPVITGQPSDMTIDAGGQATFTVISSDPTATYQWYEGIRGDRSKPVAEATASTLTVLQVWSTTSYWCEVMKPGVCSAESTTARAIVCRTASIESDSWTSDPERVFEDQTVYASVAAAGTSVSYRWDLVPMTSAGPPWSSGAGQQLSQTGPVVTVKAPASGTWGLRAIVTSGCGSGSTSIPVLAKVFRVIEGGTTSLPQCEVDIATKFPSTVRLPLSHPTVYLEITVDETPDDGSCDDPATANVVEKCSCDDPATAGVVEQCGHRIKWFVDGKERGSNWNLAASVDSGIAVTALVDRRCPKPARSAPTRQISTFVYKPQNCAVPPLIVDQGLIGPDSTSTGFTASSPWPTLTYVWYRGDSGNTFDEVMRSEKVPASTYKPSLGEAGTYWVRAYAPCGTYADSATLRVETSNSCTPIEFLMQPQGAEIEAGSEHTMQFELSAAPAINKLAWYLRTARRELQTNERRFKHAPRVSTRYHVVAEATGCHTARSADAIVRVTSCRDINVLTAPPVSQTIIKGQTVSLSASATSPKGAVRYEWYAGEPGLTLPIAFTGDLPPFAPEKTTTYWLRILAGDVGVDGCGIDLEATVNVCEPPVIGSEPAGATNPPGFRRWLGVGALGTNLSYQWYRGERGDISNPVPTGIYPELLVGPNQTTDYWVKVSNDCGEAQSLTAKVSIPPVLQGGLAGGPVTKGSVKRLTVSADGTQLRYQWYEGHDDSRPLAGKTDRIFDTPPINADVTYWARVWSGDAWVDTNSATFEVCQPREISVGAHTRVAGSQVLLTLVSPDANEYYEWYTGESGNTANRINVAAATTESPLVTTKYWVRTKRPECDADSKSVTVPVCFARIDTQPQSKMINPGQTAELSVATTGDPGRTYQWYEGPSGDTSRPVSGATSPAFVTPALSAPASYWVAVRHPANELCASTTVNSVAASITICEPPRITLDPMSRNSVSGFGFILGVEAHGTDLAYKWYIGNRGDTSNPLSFTTANITIAPQTTTRYWVRVSGRCGSTDSTAAVISIPPKITAQPQGRRVTKGTSHPVSVTASGAELTYQWYQNSTAIAGATNASYTTPALNADTTYFVRVSSADAWLDSEPALFTVCQPRGIVVSGWSGVTGSSVTLRVDAADANEQYEWYAGPTGTTTSPAGTGSQISVSPLVTAQYWLRTKRGTECHADSAVTIVPVCYPKISQQPIATQMINSGATATMSVTASGDATLLYQWYEGASGDTTKPISGATGASYTTPALTAAKSYWVAVSNQPSTYCSTRTVKSTTSNVTICEPPSISAHPLAAARTGTAAVPLSFGAGGTGLTYQWYEGPAGNTTRPISGATAKNISVTPAVTTYYWARVTGSCGTADTTAAKVSVPPGITTQPAGGPITKGTTRTLSVVASGTELTYQWYDGAGTALANGNSASFTTPAIHADSSFWVRVFSGGSSSTDSATVTLTVCQPRSVVVSQPSSVTGSAVYLGVDVAGSGETFEWYRGATGNTSAPAGTGAQLTVHPADTTTYWVRTKRSGCDADSAAVTVYVCDPSIGSHPASVGIVEGQSTTLSVTAAGPGPLSYQWYLGDSPSMVSPIGGATASSYATGALSATTKYWVRVTSTGTGCAPRAVNSTTATVSVCSPPRITQAPMPDIVTATQSVTLQVTATGAVSYQWYEGASGVTTRPVGTNNYRLTIVPGTTKWYWVRVTGACGSPADSAAVQVSVMPAITTHPAGVVACSGHTKRFTVAAQGDALSYQWYKQPAGTYTPQPIGTNASYVDVVAADMEVWVAVTSGQATSSSNRAVMTVTASPYATAGYTRRAGGIFELQAAAPLDDPETIEYRWYEGRVGDTSRLISWSYYVSVMPASLPSSYWVRVTSTSSNCYTDVQMEVR